MPQEKSYVDVRFEFDRFQEFEDEPEIVQIKSIKRIKVNDLSEGELLGIGESFYQTDRLQIMLCSDLINVISDGVKFKA